MPSRAEVRLLQLGQKEVARRARAELAGWWELLDKTDLDRLRSEVEEFFPTLIREYGRVGEAVAADWYESVYRERASIARDVSNEQMARARARWALGGVPPCARGGCGHVPRLLRVGHSSRGLLAVTVHCVYTRYAHYNH